LQELYEDDGNIEALFTTFWRLPLLYLTLMAVRFVCIALFNPLFQLTNAGMKSVASSLLYSLTVLLRMTKVCMHTVWKCTVLSREGGMVPNEGPAQPCYACSHDMERDHLHNLWGAAGSCLADSCASGCDRAGTPL